MKTGSKTTGLIACAVASALSAGRRVMLAGVIMTAFCSTALCGQALADGALSLSTLRKLVVSAPAGAALPLQSTLVDTNGKSLSLSQALDGRPAVIAFVDFECHGLCGALLLGATRALHQTGLRPGLDYRLLVIGLRADRSWRVARRMRDSILETNTPQRDALLFLTGSKEVVNSAAAALSYPFSYDSENEQFAHPAAVFVVTQAGRLTRALSALSLDAGDLRLALIEAGNGRNATVTDRIHLLCYGFDPGKGRYTRTIMLWLEAGGVTTFALLVVGLLFLIHRSQGRAAA